MFLTTEQLWIVTSACSIRSEGEAASHACSNSSQDRGDGFLQVGTAQIAGRGKRRPGWWRAALATTNRRLFVSVNPANARLLHHLRRFRAITRQLAAA